MDRESSNVRGKLINLWSKRESGTQASIAHDMGITQSALSQYLTGRVPLNTDIIIKFAQVLNVYPYEIDASLDWSNFNATKDKEHAK
jgi:transcriptional regulator with XRE-family HTH domain